MRFRTEIEANVSPRPITADERLVFLGSCFADNMGARLQQYGFDVTSNPLGPLFNPASLASAAGRALDGRGFGSGDLTEVDGTWHCLDAAARYCSPDSEALLRALNDRFRALTDALATGDCTLFVTFGTAYIYEYATTGRIVANCHRLPPDSFVRRRMSVDEITAMWRPLMERLRQKNIRTIFTVSPVRHVADGLHANNISKSTLMLAVDALGAEYFPAYEIVCDDLRDYRFYAPDLKHPSETAVDYIYEVFAETYFSAATKETAARRHAQYLREAHRPQPPIL